MNRIHIHNINRALRIISCENRNLLIASTPEGAKLAYFKDVAFDKDQFFRLRDKELKDTAQFPQNYQELILKLYQESLNFLKGNFSQSEESLHVLIETDFSHFNDYLNDIKKQQTKKKSVFGNIQLKLNPDNINSSLTWLKEISDTQKTEKKIFDNRITLQLLIVYDPGWGREIASHLESLFLCDFLNTAIFIPDKALLVEQQKILQWLEALQDSGYTFPVLFSSPQSMIHSHGEIIIQTIIQNGLARYIEIDPFCIPGLKNHREKKEYMENYTRLISSWIQKESYPILGFRDFIRLFTALIEPLEKRFVFLVNNHSFFKWKEVDREKRSSLWKDFSLRSIFLGELFPSLLPFHSYEERSGRIKPISKDLVIYHAGIYEDCIKFLIQAILKECEESIEGNRPLTLDLNLNKPVYISGGWEKARAVVYSSEKEKKE